MILPAFAKGPPPGNYDRHPFVPVGSAQDCAVGWPAIAERLRRERASVVCIECYPGVRVDAIVGDLSARLGIGRVIRAEDALRPTSEIERIVRPWLTDDPVFGRLAPLSIDDLQDPERLRGLRAELAGGAHEPALVVGPGASRLCDGGLLVYADLARWEIQARQRRGEAGSLGAQDRGARPAELYKRGYFVDWRLADRLKVELWDRIDFVLDTHDVERPKMVPGSTVRAALRTVSARPFRVVPFFDPGPWGGQWMREAFGLPEEAPNYAWCFDCVPEENSLRLGFGDERVELPSLDLVLTEPERLLGAEIHRALGAEFPIRFDFLDTVGGGNLSLQVHPLRSYIRERFGLNYTQDESYYLLDAAPDATVYLGLKTGVDRVELERHLRAAQEGGAPFDAERFVNRWPAARHDHFLIPAGTVHCSGAGGMVLEISATPYIFTFKLWDWERVGLDGRPRPIHLDHGLANIQLDRDTEWVAKNLVARVTPLDSGPGWRSERTGLHELEFIETHRHWFTGPVPHHTHGGVQVLNLVQGSTAVVESPTQAFPPFEVHYAETFIVPASVGAYRVRPVGHVEEPLATIKAFVRPGALRGAQEGEGGEERSRG